MVAGLSSFALAVALMGPTGAPGSGTGTSAAPSLRTYAPFTSGGTMYWAPSSLTLKYSKSHTKWKKTRLYTTTGVWWFYPGTTCGSGLIGSTYTGPYGPKRGLYYFDFAFRAEAPGPYSCALIYATEPYPNWGVLATLNITVE